MDDRRYDHALTAGLVILEEWRDDMPKHRLLSLLVYTILLAFDSYESERASHAPSLN